MKYIMALDAGTTSNRCLLFDQSGKIAAMAQQEFRQFYPQPGWVEHDANEIYYSQLTVAHEAMKKAGVSWKDIAGIGIANQRETAVVWNRETGEPVYNAIVWQCRRTSAYCDTLKEQGYGPMIREKTGLLPDAYFAGTKVRWILNHVPGAREDAEKGLLLFGTVESWLIWKLTGGAVHVTDYSNASRTMLFNIRTLDWDADILSLLEIPRCMLPKPVENSCYIGETAKGVFGGPIPILGAAGDQQAALFGQTCFTPGEAKNTYGTGCFLLMNTGTKPVFTDSGLITTIAWGMDGKVNYALEGSVFVAGAAIQWLRDELHLINSSAETEECARRAPDTAGCYLVPAFAGLGTPYWNQYARGCLVGLTRGTNRDHIVRAALESLAYQTQDILTTMEEVSQIRLSTLKVDGGASANNFLMQFQADITAKPVQRPACVETTAMGAAYLAGLAAGIWDGPDALKTQIETPQYFMPSMDKQLRENKLKGWKKAVQRSLDWETN